LLLRGKRNLSGKVTDPDCLDGKYAALRETTSSSTMPYNYTTSTPVANEKALCVYMRYSEWQKSLSHLASKSMATRSILSLVGKPREPQMEGKKHSNVRAPVMLYEVGLER
jgi:hypothetical protein